MGDDDDIILFKDEDAGIIILNTPKLSAMPSELYKFKYRIFYQNGRFGIGRYDTSRATDIDDYCEQLGKLGFEFKPMEPRLLHGFNIEPTGETRLMLVLKGVIEA